MEKEVQEFYGGHSQESTFPILRRTDQKNLNVCSKIKISPFAMERSRKRKKLETNCSVKGRPLSETGKGQEP